MRCFKCWGKVIIRDGLDGKEMYCITCSHNQLPPKKDPDLLLGKPKKLDGGVYPVRH